MKKKNWELTRWRSGEGSRFGEGGKTSGGESVATCEESGVNSESDLVVLVFKGRPRCSNHSHHRFLVRHCCLKTGRPKDRRIGSVVERERGREGIFKILIEVTRLYTGRWARVQSWLWGQANFYRLRIVIAPGFGWRFLSFMS